MPFVDAVAPSVSTEPPAVNPKFPVQSLKRKEKSDVPRLFHLIHEGPMTLCDVKPLDYQHSDGFRALREGRVSRSLVKIPKLTKLGSPMVPPSVLNQQPNEGPTVPLYEMDETKFLRMQLSHEHRICWENCPFYHLIGAVPMSFNVVEED